MNYYEIEFSFNESISQWEIDLLKDSLLSVGFDSFMDNEQDNGFKGYCPEKDFNKDKTQYLIDNAFSKEKVKTKTNLILDQDWNSEWEKDVPSVKFGDFCMVRPESKPQDKRVRYDIIINPRQSFGTATHPTTAMIIEILSTIEVKGKSVMDMGCGTGVLGILCKKMGAIYVESIDNDKWAYENAVDNAQKNDVDILLKEGGSEKISKDKLFDIFIANINLNILLDNIPQYVKHIKKGGMMIMSGFYKEDIDTLLQAVKPYNLSLSYSTQKDNWAAIIIK
jgi:ribosomal protein L11 methyltransferase